MMAATRNGFVALALSAAALLPALPAAAADFVGITDRGELLYFSDADPGQAVRRGLHGTGHPLVGFDVRPADGRLYGINTQGAIFMIDVPAGIATFKAMLSVPLAKAGGYLVDFNPVADRLRVVGAGGQNLRVDVDTGAAAVDQPIRYAAGGGQPQVQAGAYTNSVRGTTQTQLFVIDGASGTYALQNPPNDGVLQPAGTGGIAADGADIWSDGTRNQGFSVAGNVLYRFDVATGAAQAIGPIGAGSIGRIIDIAVLPGRM
ncbi:uncharacterized protein DUF4394 [Stella humosa]|uniref:Uncharacterized protein DUF4394 n=1 Tax=Stella humosa TaxID=94 RepID=A0A3N1LWL0_9PROT|nr:DUF4394 domain-containing protein [Stella humosa]ROP99563.1 uncharacterized protein DUF4394 [Stella humosa]BBK31216.1 lipoprotein [Stella humosa]